jgi:hypothetical protein
MNSIPVIEVVIPMINTTEKFSPEENSQVRRET